MKRIEQAPVIAVLATVLTWPMGARAAIENAALPSERTYQSIVERNPFGLKPIPPPPPLPPVTNQVAKSNLKLTGFTTFGIKRAYFMWTDEKSKTPEPFTLTIDQEVNGLKLLAVGNPVGSVRVLEQGMEKLLTFQTHGITNAVQFAGGSTTPGVPGAAGVPPPLPAAPRPMAPIPSPIVTPGTLTPTPATSAGTTRIPSRNIRSQASPDVPAVHYAGAGAPGTVAPVPLPIASPGSLPLPTPQPDANLHEQILQLELQRRLNPNLPPTPGIPTP